MNASRNCDVGAVQVAHEVEDRVGLAGSVGLSSSSRASVVRAERPRSPTPRPGVSMRVRSASFRDGQPTVDPLDRLERPARRGRCRSAPSSRRKGELARAGGRSSAVTRYPRAWRYQVTIRVHSPASVAASRSPTRALRSVDLPALTRPAMATRSGSSRRRTTAVDRRLDWSVPSATRTRLVGDAPDLDARSPGPVDMRRARASDGRSTQLPVSWTTEWSGLATRMHICVASPGRSVTLYSVNGDRRRRTGSMGPCPGMPGLVGGTVSKKKWTWRAGDVRRVAEGLVVDDVARRRSR